MQHVVRWTFTSVAVASAVLCVALCALWVRSFATADGIHIDLPQREPTYDDGVSLLSGRGGLRLSFDRRAEWEFGVLKPTRAAAPSRFVIFHLYRPFYPYALNRATFQRWGIEVSQHTESIGHTSVGSGVVYEWNAVAPDWLLVLIMSLPPALWVRRAIRGRRRPGQCQVCGYDIRATPERCPECGTVPQFKQGEPRAGASVSASSSAIP